MTGDYRPGPPRFLLESVDPEVLAGEHEKFLLFLDYDGTLTPIRQRPEDAQPSLRTSRLIDSLAVSERVQLVIISGRRLDDIRSLFPGEKLIVVAVHGAVVSFAREAVEYLVPLEEIRPLIAAVKEKVEGELWRFPGCFLEDKDVALSLHYRLADQESSMGAQEVFRRVFRESGAGKYLSLLNGKKVVEIKPSGYSKGRAVNYLRSLPRFETAFPMYFGDDYTDEDGFKAVGGAGLTVKVTENPARTRARFYLRNPGEVEEFLSIFNEALHEK